MTTLEQELGKDCFQESQKLLNDEEDETSTDSIVKSTNDLFINIMSLILKLIS